MSGRLDVVVTGDTPIGDVYGPPEELADLVAVMLEDGDPVPQDWLDLLEQWHANNDHLTLFRSSEEGFHLKGGVDDHDQKSHGRRYTAVGDLAEPDSGFTVDTVRLKPITTGFAVAVGGTDRLVLAADAFDKDGEPSKRLVRLTKERIDAAQAAGTPDGTRLALGAWHNPEDGKIEVNVTAVFPNTERARALQFAIDNDQISMADLDAITRGDWDNAIISTGGTGGNRDTEDDLPLAASGPVRQFHLKGTADDHDQSTHAGGGSSGQMTWEQVKARYPVYSAMDHAVNELAHILDGEMVTSSLVYTEEMVDLRTVKFQRYPANDDRMASLMGAYKDGVDLPPVLLVERAGELHTADGHHRLSAQEAMGLDSVPAVVAHSLREDRYSGVASLGYTTARGKPRADDDLPLAASAAELANDREPGEHRSYDTAKWRTETRKKVLKRDKYRCKLKLEGCTGKATQVDHIRNDGPSTPSNLRASCASCNGKRAAKNQHR